MTTAHTLFTALTLTATITGGAHAALLAEYNFNDGTANNAASASYNLSAVGAGAVLADGIATFDGNPSSYLQTSAVGTSGVAAFTVSIWVNASDISQGDFKSLFSNNFTGDPNDAFAWQVDNHSGVYRLISNQGASIVGSVAPEADVWQNVVVVKESGTSAKLYVDGQLAGSQAANLGNLNDFRIAINRGTSQQYAGDYDKIQIWNSVENIGDIYAAGHLNATHSWIAGRGGDVSGDATWQALTGGVNLSLSSGSESLSASNLGPAPFAYSSLAGTGGGNANIVFGGTGDATFETIIRVNDLVGNEILWEVGGNGNGSSLLLEGNILQLSAQNTSTNRMTVTTTLDNNAVGQWLHIVGVITESGVGDDTLELFVNGQSAGADTIADGSFVTWAGGSPWGLGTIGDNFGGADPGSVGNFTGDIALFNHYDFALTSTEVYDQYKFTGIPAPAALPAGLALLALAAARRKRHTR